jgi:hypothetical protein
MGAGTKPAPAILAPGVLDAINKGEGAFPEDLLGVDLMTIPGFQSGTKTAPLPAGTAPGTSVKIGEPGAVSKPRPETAAQMMERIATADAGMTTDMGPDEALMQQIAMDDAGMTTDMSAEEQEAAAEAAFQENVDQTDRDDATVDLAPDATAAAAETAEAEAAAAARTDTDPNAGASITAPKPKPENFAEIVAQAKAANASEGVPDQGSDQQEIKTAMETGTGSPEDIKAEFLKLLPKYEEDPSIQGLNIAMMGFAIAGGESSSAMKNIADGMKKTLPAFIKSKEKRKAFERETDLLASKYAIQRSEGDRTRGLTENTYFATAAFDNPITGEKVEAGQIFRLNDKAFKLAEQQGLTKFLTTPALQAQHIAAQGKVDAARIKDAGGGLDDYYEKSVFVEVPGLDQKIRVRYPTAQGEALGLQARPAGGKGGWDKFTQGYVGQLDRIVFADQGIQAAIDLADQGEALGASGVIGRLTDATKALIPEKYGKRLGIDYKTLSEGGQYEVLNRNLALQLAPIILNEGGKTISNQDRALVAQALGYNIDANGNILFGGGLVNTFKTKGEAMTALRSIQGILRKNATELHTVYQSQASEFGYTMPSVDERRQAATSSANTAQTGGFSWQEDDDGILNLVGS